MLTKANYRKLQRTVKRKWNKKIFSTSNLQISIHFLLPLLMSHGHEMLALWLTVKYMRPPQILLFLFMFQKNRIKKRRRQKLMTLLINQVLLRWENMLVLRLLQKHSCCCLIVETCVIHLCVIHYPYALSGSIDKQHRAVMGQAIAEEGSIFSK